ncbi:MULTISPECIES: hypothetical protein [unclassified Pseudofrankia]|uniref:hypothetical protein n=1 Tax=unclassified Pseudofrankia TaxID=2994372 RepID=UPI0010424A61|nr:MULTISPECIES: hypothetical protein [unclassified Pseudofrankia]MDT3442238.1 hypothetical protein [Pseudofrankia sp. BMG5.37]
MIWSPSDGGTFGFVVERHLVLEREPLAPVALVPGDTGEPRLAPQSLERTRLDPVLGLLLRMSERSRRVFGEPNPARCRK